MDEELYLPHVPGGRWAISRLVGRKWIHLVQDSYLENPDDAETILRALGIPATEATLDLYFPHRKGQGRCPTLALLELCNVLDPTNPIGKKNKKGQVGV